MSCIKAKVLPHISILAIHASKPSILGRSLLVGTQLSPRYFRASSFIVGISTAPFVYFSMKQGVVNITILGLGLVVESCHDSWFVGSYQLYFLKCQIMRLRNSLFSTLAERPCVYQYPSCLQFSFGWVPVLTKLVGTYCDRCNLVGLLLWCKGIES
jgi:hypothetical protein